MNYLSQNSQHLTFSAQNPSVPSCHPQNKIWTPPQPGKASESPSHQLCCGHTEVLLCFWMHLSRPPQNRTHILFWCKVTSSLPGFSTVSSLPSFRHQFKVSLEDTVTDHPRGCHHTPSHGHPDLNNSHFHFPLSTSLKLVSHSGDLSGGPVVKNPPSSAGDKGLIPGWERRSHTSPSN